jgi:hypothetical protein
LEYGPGRSTITKLLARLLEWLLPPPLDDDVDALVDEREVPNCWNKKQIDQKCLAT